MYYSFSVKNCYNKIYMMCKQRGESDGRDERKSVIKKQ